MAQKKDQKEIDFSGESCSVVSGSKASLLLFFSYE
jgi:hypothetical protein